MKRNFWVKLSAVIFSVILLIPASIGQGTAEAASQKNNDSKPSIKEYDANGNLVKTYSDVEIKTFMEEAEELNKLLEVESKNTGERPAAYFYDENNLLTGSTDTNAVKAEQDALEQIMTTASNKTYKYSATTFKNSVMVAGGSYFKNPQSITVNPKQKVYSLLIKTYKEGDATASGSVKVENFSTGINVPLVGIAQNKRGSGNYKVQFNNSDTVGSTIYLNAGTLYYK
ncbi:hypothetical protein [Pseudobacillus badius]|uniref:hypothetical protein n=1 Tax=Bacillus badius TaxID=1455 RepID=UPI0007B35C1F|nr:hypothetical protein [Bacillus badius]KZR56676.1 hypothetical protein A3781_06830 [Bacillus badius]